MLPLLLVAALGTSADLVVDPGASHVTSDSSLVANFPGTLIGNWDAETNPEGTQTRPGLFGGSGNMPVDMTIGTIVDGSFSSDPTGGLTIDFDTESLIASVSNLEIDLLGGATVPLTIELGFETFRTFNPGSLYIGITIPLPLGEASVTQLAMTQTGGSTGGLLVPIGDGTFLLTALVPVELTLGANAFGQVLEPVPFPVVLPFAGTLDPTGRLVNLAVSFEQAFGDDTPGPPGSGFENIPLDLPTILPPGSTASLLLTATLANIVSNFGLTVDLVASGDENGAIDGDINGDGEVNFDDLLLLLGDWGACEGCPTDINGDGVAGFDDLLILLGNWGE